MIYADGAGVAIVEGVETTKKEGILAHKSRTLPYFEPETGLGSSAEPLTDCSQYLFNGPSNNPAYLPQRLFLKMRGPQVAQVARTYVPEVIREVLDQADIQLESVKMFLLHQANRQLDHDMALDSGIREEDLDTKVPMTIGYLGNSSVATIPTMLDLITRGELENGSAQRYTLNPGDLVVFASVGGSMHVNALLYRVPQQSFEREF